MINAINLYMVAQWLLRKNIPILPQIFTLLIFLIYNSKVPASAKIGKGTKLAYGGIGVVIHNRAVIGQNTMIGTQVTIGGRSGHYEVPVIGNNVDIATGAKILGPIRIGDNAIIGANAVVINDVPSKAVVAGVPAKIIKFIDAT